MIDLKKVSHASIFLLAFSLLKILFSIAVKMSMAQFFGASPASDAYFAAQSIPQELGNYLLGGIIFIVIIPVFQKRSSESGKEDAYEELSSLLTLASFVLFLVFLAYFFLIPFIIPLIFSGFDEATMKLTVDSSRLLSPTLFLMGMTLLYASFYHAHKDFVTPSLAALAFPLISLFSLWLLPAGWGISRLIYGNLAGSLLGLLILCVVIHKKIRWKFRLRKLKNTSTLKAAALAWPLLLALIIGKAIPFIQKNLASKLEPGSVSVMEFSFFIIAFASTAVLAPVATASFPAMAEQHVNESEETSAGSFTKTLSTILFLSMPIFVLFISTSKEIVTVLFRYGIFSEEKTAVCAKLLIIYSFIILPMAVTKLSSNMFYARHETKEISLLTSLITILWIPFFFISSKYYGIYGLTGAFVSMHILISLLSLALLRFRNKSIKVTLLLKGILLFAVPGLAMFLSILLLRNLTRQIPWTLLNLIILSSAGFISYFLVTYLMKLPELRFILEKIPVIGKRLDEKLFNSKENKI